jgi:hypothetical protein
MAHVSGSFMYRFGGFQRTHIFINNVKEFYLFKTLSISIKLLPGSCQHIINILVIPLKLSLLYKSLFINTPYNVMSSYLIPIRETPVEIGLIEHFDEVLAALSILIKLLL